MDSPAIHPRPSHVRVCVSAVVVRGGCVLLLRRGPGAPFGVGDWHCPSGGVEPGDRSLVDAAARELREETGLVGHRGRVVAHVDGLDRERPFVSFLVRFADASGSVDLTDPASDTYAWWPVDQIPENTWDRDLLAEVLR
jgi:8-oxo-dGTP diphosphatase